MDGQIHSPQELSQQIIAWQNKGPIRLKDVAKVTYGAENNRLVAWKNLTPALILNVQKQPSANSIAVVDAIKASLPSLQASLPSGITVTLLTDRTTTIRSSIHNVSTELLLSIILVTIIIYVFLGNLSATLVPTLSIPLSLIGSLGVMHLLGYSLNNLTLMALTIATGFVVDDAIVMIENINRYKELGYDRVEAALKGTTEISFTIISLTVSLIAVLIPILFIGDIVGRLFHEFAVTLATTILISCIVSLTLVPMMCARLPDISDDYFYITKWLQCAETQLARLIKSYGRWLDFVIRHQQ